VIALLVRESFGNRGSQSTETKLMFLDGATGRHVETRLLERGTTTVRWRNLSAVGRSLMVMGAEKMIVLESGR
jgi:hypothetical protein